MVEAWNLAQVMSNYKWYNVIANNDNKNKNKSNNNPVKTINAEK